MKKINWLRVLQWFVFGILIFFIAAMTGIFKEMLKTFTIAKNDILNEK